MCYYFFHQKLPSTLNKNTRPSNAQGLLVKYATIPTQTQIETLIMAAERYAFIIPSYHSPVVL